VGSQECAKLTTTGEAPKTVSGRVKLRLNSGVGHSGSRLSGAPNSISAARGNCSAACKYSAGARKADMICVKTLPTRTQISRSYRYTNASSVSAVILLRLRPWLRDVLRPDHGSIRSSAKPALPVEPTEALARRARGLPCRSTAWTARQLSNTNSRQTSCQPAHWLVGKSPFVSDFSAERNGNHNPLTLFYLTAR
jgi:hypothetical protein